MQGTHLSAPAPPRNKPFRHGGLEPENNGVFIKELGVEVGGIMGAGKKTNDL